GDIGAASSFLNTHVTGSGAGAGLTVTATTGSAYINNSGAVQLNNSSAGNDFQLNATGTITAASLTADPITMTSTGDINFTGNLTGTGILVVAGGNVTATGSSQSINASGTNGGNITIVA